MAFIMAGGRCDIDLASQVRLSRHGYRLTVGAANVVIRLDPRRPRQLAINGSRCAGACAHQGAARSLMLEERRALGPA